MAHRRDVQSFFDEDSATYSTKHYETDRSFMTVRQERILEALDRLGLDSDSLVLDAGCGPGHLSTAMAARGHRVCCVDASPKMLELARGASGTAPNGSRMIFCRASIESLPFEDGGFDSVCSAGVLEYLDDDRPGLAELCRMVRPGGLLFIPITNAWSPVLWLDTLVEAAKRCRLVRALINRILALAQLPPLRPRRFRVRRQRRAEIHRLVESHGFSVCFETYFYFMPWPRPFDKLLPAATAALGRRLERFGRSWIGPLAEGHLTVAKRSQTQDSQPGTHG